MVRRVASVAGALTAMAALAGCSASKSSNPLSPTVAGPIPGVNISAPQPMTPAAGAKVAVDQQPITLMVNNATTNGVRPLNYLFEVAADAGFTNKVFSRDGVTPGDGRTSLKLPDALATGRSYYWHARAQDGANTGPYSDPASFSVFTPVVIQPPVLVSPINNATADSMRPALVWNNATRTGPAGAITYLVEVATNDTFGNKVAVTTVSERANQTSYTVSPDLSFSTQYFWHVRASDPTTVSPF